MLKLFNKNKNKELLEIVMEENISLKKSVIDYQMEIYRIKCNFGKLKWWAKKNNYTKVLNKIEELEK